MASGTDGPMLGINSNHHLGQIHTTMVTEVGADRPRRLLPQRRHHSHKRLALAVKVDPYGRHKVNLAASRFRIVYDAAHQAGLTTAGSGLSSHQKTRLTINWSFPGAANA